VAEQNWRVEVSFTEDGDRTRADAVLELLGQRFHGFGQARRAPQDPSVPVIGEELAAARALSHLSHQLLEAAVERIGGFEGHPVDVRE
jgi:Rv2632c-like